MDDTDPANDLLRLAELDHETLNDASDEQLLRLAASYKRGDIEDMESLSTEAMVTLMLRKRGYQFHRDEDSVDIEAPDGERQSLTNYL
ncbi:hypothetical protein KTS45_11210 [Halomicroarcula limicola]|uniref:Uncharacterized protein n=1 Tax=Haloarcula limicola TaxID=1429915 RepID=A0A8J7Y5R4_9EURY|nr:hypothetical protein [Halomicroarcula limicola]MBV0924767.1 hypothetical protein [Halomicroarcula limicola]